MKAFPFDADPRWISCLLFRALAEEAGVLETTYEPILAGVKKRAGLVE
jgi:hypothetical protein